MCTAHELTDKLQILTYLERDRLYAAYAIGDLEPELFVQSTWAGAKKDGQLLAIGLHFRGLRLPALFLMGHNDGLQAVLQDVLHPSRAYLTCRIEHLPIADHFYTWERTISMWRLALPRGRFRPVRGPCTRLGPGAAAQLAALYATGPGNEFQPSQMKQGVFFGVSGGGQLLAAAGTHLVSERYGVAAVGNVFTHPRFRGQGLATLATSAVVEELLRRNIGDIILNVEQANAAAIHVYERLGFERYCPFLEGPASLRLPLA